MARAPPAGSDARACGDDDFHLLPVADRDDARRIEVSEREYGADRPCVRVVRERDERREHEPHHLVEVASDLEEDKVVDLGNLCTARGALDPTSIPHMFI